VNREEAWALAGDIFEELCRVDPPISDHARSIARAVACSTILGAESALTVVAVPEQPRHRADKRPDGPGTRTDVKAYWAAREAWRLMTWFETRPALTDGGPYYVIAGHFYMAVGGDPTADVVVNACRAVFRHPPKIVSSKTFGVS